MLPECHYFNVAVYYAVIAGSGFSLWMKPYCVTIQMKAIEPAELYDVVQPFLCQVFHT